jgi:signal peptidase II
MTRGRLFALAFAILLIDRLTKYWVETALELWDTHPVIPGFFNLVHTQNRGVAFGILNEDPGRWQQAVLTVITGAVLAFLSIQLWRGGGPPLSRLAFALVLGGAMGNLIDRMAFGAVTDFLEFYAGPYRWPAFNVADSAITAGAILLALDMLRARRQPVEA